MKDTGDKKCKWCGGYGEIVKEGKEIDCPPCKGTGKLANSEDIEIVLSKIEEILEGACISLGSADREDVREVLFSALKESREKEREKKFTLADCLLEVIGTIKRGKKLIGEESWDYAPHIDFRYVDEWEQTLKEVLRQSGDGK